MKAIRSVSLLATALVTATTLLAPSSTRAQVGMGYGVPNFGQEPLLEVPIFPVPAEMTLPEYRAANRRMGAALVRFIIPGGIHFYADEHRTGWWLVGTTSAGVAALVAGLAVAFAKDEKLEDTPYDTVTLGRNNVVYARIPKQVNAAGQYVYDLVPLKKERETSNVGVGIAVTGGLLIAGSYLFDLIHGLVTIERKRDEVRYKYGSRLPDAVKRFEERQTRSIRVTPSADPQTGTYALQFGSAF